MQTGCAMCSNDFDCFYGAYGGRVCRDDMVCGRVNSVIRPAGGCGAACADGDCAPEASYPTDGNYFSGEYDGAYVEGEYGHEEYLEGQPYPADSYGESFEYNDSYMSPDGEYIVPGSEQVVPGPKTS